MLPKKERIKNIYLFNTAFNIGRKNNQKITTDLLLLYYLFKKKEASLGLPKTAFVVGTKIEKKASKRNLIKRRMRSAYRFFRDRIVKNDKLNKVSVLIWIANHKIKEVNFEEIKNSMKKILDKLELRSSNSKL